MHASTRFRVVTACAFSTLAAFAAHAAEKVTVYTALDRQFSEPILRDFTSITGIDAHAVYDTESTKSVGLANRIRAESQRPRCDVFWNNEILNTLRLKSAGMLQPCNPPNAQRFPPAFRDPDGHWFGFAARARVVLVNTELVKPADFPSSIRDLAHERFRGRAGIAKPLFGTTASHVACLFALLGPDSAKNLLLSLKRNDIQIIGGNKGCAEMVGGGRLLAALTDTDDAIAEIDAGRPVRIIFPDSSDGAMGTPLLPNTASIIKGAPNPASAEKLVDFLLSPEVEARLARGASAQIPLGADCPAHSRLGDVQINPMHVDFEKAAAAFDDAARFIEAEFLK